MKQGNAALVGLGLCELQQRVNLEAHSIPGVTSLENTPGIIIMQDLSNNILKSNIRATYVVEEIPNIQN